MLGEFLEANGIKQTDLADGLSRLKGIPVDKAQVNRWARDASANPTRENIDAILLVASGILGRPVTYEEAFSQPALPPAVGE